MVKNVNIEEKIAQLNALKSVIEYTEGLKESMQNEANSYLESCKDEEASTETETVYDTSNWNYERYEDYQRQANAYEAIVAELNKMV